MKQVLPCILVIIFAHSFVLGQNSGTIKVKAPVEKKKAILVQPSIGGYTGGLVTKSQLLVPGQILVNDSITVIRYSFLINSGIRAGRTVESNTLSNFIVRFLKRSEPGDIVYFRNILCKDKNGLQFMAEDLEFEIIAGTE